VIPEPHDLLLRHGDLAYEVGPRLIVRLGRDRVLSITLTTHPARMGGVRLSFVIARAEAVGSIKWDHVVLPPKLYALLQSCRECPARQVNAF